MYSDDQIIFVNQMSILVYAQAAGLGLDYKLKHVLVKGVDSREITLDDREWYYHYMGIGGRIVQFATWLQDIRWKDPMQQNSDY